MADGTTVGAACDIRRVAAPACYGADGLTCDSGTNMCATQPLVAAGQACGVIGTTVTACLAGASCIIPAAAAAGTCVAPASDGAACDSTNGPNCQFPARCVAGTCQLPGSMKC